MDEHVAHLKNFYGICEMGEACKCVQPVKRTSPIVWPEWKGVWCEHWKPDVPEQLLKALGITHP